MDKFDRNKQRELLTLLYKSYPSHISREDYKELKSLFGSDDELVANLLYLEQHNLLVSGVTRGMNDYVMNLGRLSITNAGIDFIRSDGGLGAELNVQIVKIHDSTLVALEDILLLSNLPEEQKQDLLAKLRGLPADAIKHLTLQLLTKAALNPQAVLHIIQTALHH
jgi:hypothetical protein